MFVGMKLKTYLSESNMTATDFAPLVDVAPSTITRLLNGERSPGIHLVWRISLATNGRVNLFDFVEGTEAPRKRRRRQATN